MVKRLFVVPCLYLLVIFYAFLFPISLFLAFSLRVFFLLINAGSWGRKEMV